MSIILRRATLPEMQGLTRDQQRTVWRQSYLNAFKEPFAWLGIGNFIVIAMIGRSLFGPMGLVFGAALGAIVWMQFHLRAAQPWMRVIREKEGLGAPPKNLSDS